MGRQEDKAVGERLVKPHKGMSMNLFIFIIFNLFGMYVVCVHAYH